MPGVRNAGAAMPVKEARMQAGKWKMESKGNDSLLLLST
jgi:hypothetical protein